MRHALRQPITHPIKIRYVHRSPMSNDQVASSCLTAVSQVQQDLPFLRGNISKMDRMPRPDELREQLVKAIEGAQQFSRYGG